MNMKLKQMIFRAVLWTADLAQFKFGPVNREVSVPHVAALTDSYVNRGYLEGFPIHCDSDKNVVSGQHRLVAAIEHQRKNPDFQIAYQEVELNGVSLEEAAELFESTVKPWTSHDHLVFDAGAKRDPTAIATLDLSARYGMSESLTKEALRKLSPGPLSVKIERTEDCYHWISDIQGQLNAEGNLLWRIIKDSKVKRTLLNIFVSHYKIVDYSNGKSPPVDFDHLASQIIKFGDPYLSRLDCSAKQRLELFRNLYIHGTEMKVATF